MGQIDSITKQYMSDNSRFADAFNYLIYDGKPIIQGDELTEQDTTELLAFLDEDGNLITKQEFRDVLKQCVIKYDTTAYYILLGIENQSNVHYAMPVKNALYDVLNYAEQVARKTKEHRKRRDLKREEFLSGFSKKDKLLPVITLTILWDSVSWDGARSLHEMLDVSDAKLLKFIPDYRLNLITPEEIKDFEQFQTELGCVLEFLNTKNSVAKTKALLEAKKVRFSHLDLESAQLLNVCANLKLEIPEKERVLKGGFDMCKAFEDYKAEGKTEGKTEGKREMSLQIYKNMPEVSVSKIAEMAGTTVDVVKGWILGAGMQLR